MEGSQEYDLNQKLREARKSKVKFNPSLNSIKIPHGLLNEFSVNALSPRTLLNILQACSLAFDDGIPTIRCLSRIDLPKSPADGFSTGVVSSKFRVNLLLRFRWG